MSCGSDHVVADVFRWITLVLGIGTFAATAAVLHVYLGAYKVAPHDRRGLVPKHVALISVAYLILVGEGLWQNVVRIGHPLTWYVPVNLVAFGIGLSALLAVLSFERRVVIATRRVQVADEYVIATVDESPRFRRRTGDHDRRHDRRQGDP